MKTSLVTLALLAVLTACGSKSASTVAASASPGVVTQPSLVVQMQPLRREALHRTMDADGQVVADAGGQATLAFPTDGQIAAVNANVGDRVSKGEVLASLDPRTATSAIVQAEADVSAAQANLAKTQARARPQEFAQNSASVQAAQAKAESAQAEMERQRALARVGIFSLRELQQAQANYQSALADLRIAQQQGSILQAGPRPQDVAVPRASVAQGEAELSAARTKASLLDIVAPFDGVIARRLKNPGETADPTTPVLASRMVGESNASDVQCKRDPASGYRLSNACISAISLVCAAMIARAIARSCGFLP